MLNSDQVAQGLFYQSVFGWGFFLSLEATAQYISRVVAMHTHFKRHDSVMKQ